MYLKDNIRELVGLSLDFWKVLFAMIFTLALLVTGPVWIPIMFLIETIGDRKNG